jgi:hypothetical protein
MKQNMILSLKRLMNNQEADAVFGELYIDNELECLTLERLSKLIPQGTYPISFYFSPHNNLLVPLLTVPNRTFVEIHPANTPDQLEGCIAVGTVHNQDSIANSRYAFTQLMSKIATHDDLTIEIS